jgi:hypothetical protein
MAWVRRHDEYGERPCAVRGNQGLLETADELWTTWMVAE